MIVVCGVVVWMLQFRPPAVPEIVTQTFIETPPDEVRVSDIISGQDTLGVLQGLGKTLECSFQFKDAIPESEGTGFFNGGKMRVDSMYTASSGEQFTSHMISDGVNQYVWSRTENGQSALPLPATQASSTIDTDMESTTALNQNTPVWYICKPWNIDGSVFIPPQSIIFE